MLLFSELTTVHQCIFIDNKIKDILGLKEGPAQELDYTTITAEAKYHINFTRSRKQKCLSRHYNGNNSFQFINSTKILEKIQSKKL